VVKVVLDPGDQMIHVARRNPLKLFFEVASAAHPALALRASLFAQSGKTRRKSLHKGVIVA
jgi:hypothetical protein